MGGIFKGKWQASPTVALKDRFIRVVGNPGFSIDLQLTPDAEHHECRKCVRLGNPNEITGFKVYTCIVTLKAIPSLYYCCVENFKREEKVCKG